MAKQFGGPWTQRKLDVVENYLEAYLTALKNQPFSLGYVDAFAGDGSIFLATSEDDSTTEVEGLIRGSAQRALALEPGFDGYVLIDQDEEAAERLQELKRAYPNKDVQIRCGDANEQIRRICYNNPWDKRRAVVFLDPTGMQVEWETMKAIASTEAMDVWIWFPLGMGANRLLTRSGDIPLAWKQRLNTIFGTTEWWDEFYRVMQDRTFFGVDERPVKIATPQIIAAYYNERLKSIFSSVASNPRIMRNSRNNPIYMLCFASANPGRGGQIAVGIASHLLNNA